MISRAIKNRSNIRPSIRSLCVKEMERTLNRELKGRFYDSNEIIRAGKKSKKFLIFTPFTKDGEKAELTFQEVYIGNETIKITFPFLLTEEGE